MNQDKAPREEEAGLRQRVADYLYDDHGQGYDGLSELEARNQSLLDADRLISITRLAKGRPAPADALREELALYKEAWEARHSYGHKQGIASPQAKRLREAEAKVKEFRDAALRGSGEG